MVRAASRKLLNKLPTADEMAAAIERLQSMDDAPAVLLGAAYLDHALELLLKSEFKRKLTADEEKRMFDGSQNAILGSFSAKIRIAYALGLVLDEVYADLLLINDIRNAFAHSLYGNVDFRNEHVLSDCNKLAYVGMWSRLLGMEVPPLHPKEIFVRTVRRIYTTFKERADKASAFFAAYEKVRASLDAPPSGHAP